MDYSGILFLNSKVVTVYLACYFCCLLGIYLLIVYTCNLSIAVLLPPYNLSYFPRLYAVKVLIQCSIVMMIDLAIPMAIFCYYIIEFTLLYKYLPNV